jgi:hypothetical protein
MKYILTESRLNKLLNDVIEDRYAGMKFYNGTFGVIGILPNKKGKDVNDSEWTMVYEKEDAVGYDRMVLWIYDDDYQYFLSMTPLSDVEVTDAVRDWFYRKTKLNADLVYIQ